jgi:PTS system nitrogen regulatory IIA component
VTASRGLGELIQKDTIAPVLEAHSKKQLLVMISEMAERQLGLDSHRVLEVLLDRERLGTTAMSMGVALPHGLFPDLDGAHGFFARLEEPVLYDEDHPPVDLVFMLLAGEGGGTEPVKALSRVQRFFRKPDIAQALRMADDQQEIYNLLQGQEK